MMTLAFLKEETWVESHLLQQPSSFPNSKNGVVQEAVHTSATHSHSH